MRHVQIGLRGKLVVAFFLVAVIPLIVVMYITSRQGVRLAEKAQELQQYHQEMMTYLTTHQEQAPSQDVITGFQENYQKAFNEFKVYLQERQSVLLILIIVITLVSSVFAFFLGNVLTAPILHLTELARKISHGELEHAIDIHAKDELRRLGSAFQSMTNYMKEMAQTANSIANGNIHEIDHPKSSRDMLGTAFYTMGQYLNNIARIVHRVSDGNFDDTITLKSSEDILGKALQKMTSNLARTLHQIKQEVQTIGTASERAAQQSEQDLKMVKEILSSAEETSSSMTQMQASVEEVSENMSALSFSVEETVSSIEEMNMSIKQIAVNTKGLSNSAQETFVIVQDIGETITRLVTTANQAENSSQEASKSASAGQMAVREIIEGMQVIQQVVSTSAETIKVLGTRSREIGSITDVISDIADQTSLLSLNASIIAAQAGEHGRGFAVVAQEVKELANRSLHAVKEIEDLIKGVRTEVDHAVQSMEKGRQAVENGVSLANRGGESLDTILASVQNTLEFIAENTRIAEEQAALSEQVRNYMGNVLTIVNEITRATEEQQKGSDQVTKAVEHMRELSVQVKRATTEQTKGTQHVLDAMDNVTLRVQESSTRTHEIARFSADLAKEATFLVELLNQFTVISDQ